MTASGSCCWWLISAIVAVIGSLWRFVVGGEQRLVIGGFRLVFGGD